MGIGNGTDLASVSSLWKNWCGSLLHSFFTIIFIFSEPMLALSVGSVNRCGVCTYCVNAQQIDTTTYIFRFLIYALAINKVMIFFQKQAQKYKNYTT